MQTRMFALVYGFVNAIMGLLGFIPGITTPPSGGHDITVHTGYGDLFGLFPTNVVHNVEHILVGLAGIAAFRSFGGARLFAQVVGAFFIAKGVMGMVPGLNTLFGMLPMYGNDVWLHLLLGGVAAYFGFVLAPREARQGATVHAR